MLMVFVPGGGVRSVQPSSGRAARCIPDGETDAHTHYAPHSRLAHLPLGPGRNGVPHPHGRACILLLPQVYWFTLKLNKYVIEID